MPKISNDTQQVQAAYDALASDYHRLYGAWRRSELSRLFRQSGFAGVRWLMPAKTGFKQPLAVARA